MKGPDLLKIGMLTAVIASGCGPVAPTTTPDIETATAYPTSTAEAPLPTPTVDVSTLDYLPPARETAIVATAQTYATEGPEALIERGFPEEAIRSYRYFKTKLDLKFMIGEEGWQYEDIGDQGGSVIIKSDRPGFEDNIYLATSGHILDPNEIGKDYIKQIGELYGPVSFRFTEVDLETIQIGDDITLNRDQFGVTHIFDKENMIDYAFFAIPKQNIPPDVLERLMADAFPGDRISFDQIKPTDRVDGVCQPVDTGFLSVPAENARYIGDYSYQNPATNEIKPSRGIMIRPWLTGGGCSGEAPVVTDENGVVKLLGLNVSNLWNDKNFSDVAIIYPFSDMGEQGFWDNMKVAMADGLLHQK